jgi:hypothetical protein
MTKISKRLLHGFCGLIVGFLLGIFLLEDYENLLWCGIAGAIIAGLLAFLCLISSGKSSGNISHGDKILQLIK